MINTEYKISDESSITIKSAESDNSFASITLIEKKENPYRRRG